MIAAVLPRLREDLELVEGDRDASGRPAFLIRDAVLDRFIRISEDTALILSKWEPGQAAEAFLDKLGASGILMDAPQFASFLNFLRQNDLVLSEPFGPQRRRIDAGGAKAAFRGMVHNYLFFRIPLIHPGRFLTRTAPRLDVLFSRGFLALTLAVLLIDVFMIGPRWDHAVATLTSQGTPALALQFGLAYLLSKSIHELAHGYAAARQGCTVSSMGIGFIVGFPVLYADVTDTWRIADPRGRLAVASAGILAELCVAVYATALWILNPVPALSEFFLYLALTIWISSLLVNGNPLMRFDGYHILSDILGERNLQPKSFAAIRAWLRYGLGFSAERPRTRTLHVVYGAASAVYRVLLITGIALLLYGISFRLLGILLFVVEIWMFLLRPVVQEFRLLWRMRGHAVAGRRSVVALGILATLGALLFVPFSTGIGAPAVVTREKATTVYTRDAGRTQETLSETQRDVAAGARILTLDDPDRRIRLEQTLRGLQILETRRAVTAIADVDRNRTLALDAEIAKERARADGFAELLEGLSPHAPEAGVFVPRERIESGTWLPARAPLGEILAGGGRAVAFVSERDLASVRPGARAVFTSDFASLVRSGRVVSVGYAAVAGLPFRELASVHGGPVQSRAAGSGPPVSEHAVYRVEIALDDAERIPARLLGSVRIESPPRSLGERAMMLVVSTFRREFRLN